MCPDCYNGPEDEYDEEYDDKEMELLEDELMGDNDSWDRSNDEGWYYGDDD